MALDRGVLCVAGILQAESNTVGSSHQEFIDLVLLPHQHVMGVEIIQRHRQYLLACPLCECSKQITSVPTSSVLLNQFADPHIQ